VVRRPAARTRLANLLLAGDWTDTGLPATIEGAIRYLQQWLLKHINGTDREYSEFLNAKGVR
jgi:hypothetical protein